MLWVSRANSVRLLPLVTHVTLSFTVLCYSSSCSNMIKNQAISTIIFLSILKINGSEVQIVLKSSSYKIIILGRAVLLRLQKMTYMYWIKPWFFQWSQQQQQQNWDILIIVLSVWWVTTILNCCLKWKTVLFYPEDLWFLALAFTFLRPQTYDWITEAVKYWFQRYLS